MGFLWIFLSANTYQNNPRNTFPMPHFGQLYSTRVPKSKETKVSDHGSERFICWVEAMTHFWFVTVCQTHSRKLCVFARLPNAGGEYKTFLTIRQTRKARNGKKRCPFACVRQMDKDASVKLLVVGLLPNLLSARLDRIIICAWDRQDSRLHEHNVISEQFCKRAQVDFRWPLYLASIRISANVCGTIPRVLQACFVPVQTSFPRFRRTFWTKIWGYSLADSFSIVSTFSTGVYTSSHFLST